MDAETFKERVARIDEIGQVLVKLPAEIRSAAFALLQDYVTGTSHLSPETKPPTHGAAEDEREVFFRSYDHDKPADNVKLLVAYLYREYGTEPFTLDELRQLAMDTGVTVPERIDMTLRQAKENGKALFTSTVRGKFKPTVHGEAYLKETYSIKKGTKTRPLELE